MITTQGQRFAIARTFKNGKDPLRSLDDVYPVRKKKSKA
jgi:hypothetical protein